MIELQVTFSEKSKQNLADLSRQFPREMVRANGRAASIVKRKFRAAMRRGGGTSDVPALAPHSAVTQLMHGSGPLGGKLAEPALIVSYRLGVAQVVGWAGSLNNWAAAFQDQEFRPTGERERAYMHKALGNQVPGYYVRPARPVVDPLIKAVAPQYPRWFEGAAKKLIEKSLAKQGF
jgi:hypothetical protein